MPPNTLDEIHKNQTTLKMYLKHVVSRTSGPIVEDNVLNERKSLQSFVDFESLEQNHKGHLGKTVKTTLRRSSEEPNISKLQWDRKLV